jgi:hypothetical protein
VGGDRLDYSRDVAISTADITKFKILINSTLSTEDSAMMMMDITNYYLGTPLPRYEYMEMLFSRFPYTRCRRLRGKMALSSILQSILDWKSKRDRETES